MIVEEKISGILCRFYPDPTIPEFYAVWVLTDEGDIMGFLTKIVNKKILRKFKMHFHLWLESKCKHMDIRCETVIESIERFLKKFNFIKLEYKGK